MSSSSSSSETPPYHPPANGPPANGPPPNYHLNQPTNEGGDFAAFLPAEQHYINEKPAEVIFTFSLIKVLRFFVLPLALTNLFFLTLNWHPLVAVLFWFSDLALVIWTAYRLVQGLGGVGTMFRAQFGTFNVSFGREGRAGEVFPGVTTLQSHLDNRIDFSAAGVNLMASILTFFFSIWVYDVTLGICMTIGFLQVAIVVLSRFRVCHRATVYIYEG